jgi:hypothetical protein
MVDTKSSIPLREIHGKTDFYISYDLHNSK